MLYRVSERVYDGSTIPPESGNFISDENLFNYQAKVLRELLNEESYICVGRAADFVLRDKPNVLTVYVDAPYDWRVEREMKRQGIGSSQAKHYIDKLDRYRESYYKYHTAASNCSLYSASNISWKISLNVWSYFFDMVSFVANHNVCLVSSAYLKQLLAKLSIDLSTLCCP